MHYVAAILFALPPAMVCFAVAMLVRNSWVYRARMRILNESRWDPSTLSHIEFDSLPSYDQMMWEFWNWNADSFIWRR